MAVEYEPGIHAMGRTQPLVLELVGHEVNVVQPGVFLAKGHRLALHLCCQQVTIIAEDSCPPSVVISEEITLVQLSQTFLVYAETAGEVIGRITGAIHYTAFIAGTASNEWNVVLLVLNKSYAGLGFE